MFAAVMNDYYIMNSGQVLPTLIESPKEESRFLVGGGFLNISPTVAPV